MIYEVIWRWSAPRMIGLSRTVSLTAEFEVDGSLFIRGSHCREPFGVTRGVSIRLEVCDSAMFIAAGDVGVNVKVLIC